MVDIPTLETERLILRAPREGDLDAEAEFYQSDRSKFVGGPMTRDQVWRAIAGLIGHWHIRGYGFWGVEEKADGAYCGHVGPWFPEGWPEPEIGWTLMARAEGRGIAREAAVAARDYAYNVLGWTTAISLIDPSNDRSIALATRIGAKQDGEFVHQRFGRMQVYRHPGPADLS